MSLSNYYGPAAYRADAIPELPSTVDDQNGILQSVLRWGHYANLEPFTELEFQLNRQAHQAYEQQAADKNPQIYWDAQRWRFENNSQIPYLLFIIKWWSLFAPWIPWGAMIIMYIGLSSSTPVMLLLSCITMVVLGLTCMALFGTSKQNYGYWMLTAGAIITAGVICWHHGAFWGFWGDETAFWIGIFLFFMAAIGSDILLGLYARFYTRDGSEFNRQTGLVSIARRFRKPFKAPFYEFDPILHLMVTPYGGHDYGLSLYHRYTGTKVVLAGRIHSLGLNKANALAFWDCLQRYMDVSQPLPDMPILEQSRHLDPTTAAYDAAHNRPPRFWRDLKYKGWLRRENQRLQQRLEAYPWQQQPCILQARMDPSLSIEAYYRRQEAKGIQATPKGDDFDNIRR